MRFVRTALAVTACFFTADCRLAFSQMADVKVIAANPNTGSAESVVIGAVPLAHTAQHFPFDQQRQIVAPDDPAAQVDAVLDRLDATLKPAGASVATSVRLNWYATRDDHRDVISRRMAARFRGAHKPTVTFVVTDLPHPGALVAADAVAFVAKGAIAPEKSNDVHLSPGLALLPPGRAVYISGQAEPAESLAAATRATMASLHRTLEYLGLGARHVVHVKTFLTDTGELPAVEREIAATFTAGNTPPLSHVEWISSVPIEIEMIAFLPADVTLPTAGETDVPARVRCFTPPGMTTSPVYSRVSVIEAGQRVYFSSIVPQAAGDHETQVRDVFSQLDARLKAAGSDWNHLVKGTYYVLDDAVSGPFGKIRGEFYNPRRPPSASKATVRGTGDAHRSIAVDLIAVTAE